MSYAGHVLQMIQRMRANREQLHSHKKSYSDKFDTNGKHRTMVEYKKLPPDELLKVKSKIRKRASRDKLRYYITTIIVFTLAMVGLFFLLI
ncbi:hypothetical protein GCQ56_00990 [Marinifilum sp. N1E240]|uniref:hypothetical protein n=1 Tax=Marinifilum sp. N1E240 TaxID=2608082 RepID=UPI00128AFE3D|nr:hypothetical protein [Marinifilum sp. N1E240]MPQ45568.1 hypothetical protein [Marinifilum sp. N1E240]